MFTSCSGYSSPNMPISEVSALQALFDSTHGDHWLWRYPTSVYGEIWNFSTPEVNPCGGWQGVTCANSSVPGQQNVIEVFLQTYNMTGRLPDSFSNLTYLNHINFDYNALTGTLTESFCGCLLLHKIFIRSSQLIGGIPACLFQNITLFQISLHDNLLHGSIPEFVNQSGLSYLSLSGNMLTGKQHPILLVLSLSLSPTVLLICYCHSVAADVLFPPLVVCVPPCDCDRASVVCIGCVS